MPQGLSFRASTALIVGAYALLIGVLVAGAGHHLNEAIAGYAPQVSWLLPGTTEARIAALVQAGRPETAALYGLTVAVSWGLIAALTSGGLAWGVLHRGDTVLGVDKALGYLTAMAALYAIATGTEILLHAFHLSLPRAGLHAIPSLWFATMVPSAAILARIGGMVAHDLGSLTAIAIVAEPARLATLVATAEERRGATSTEARIARWIARPRG